MITALLVVPSAGNALTRVVSIANWAPPNRGNPFGTTLSLQLSATLGPTRSKFCNTFAVTCRPRGMFLQARSPLPMFAPPTPQLVHMLLSGGHKWLATPAVAHGEGQRKVEATRRITLNTCGVNVVSRSTGHVFDCTANSQTAQRHGHGGTIPRLDIDRCRVDLEDLTQTREHVLHASLRTLPLHWIDASESVGGPRSCTEGQKEPSARRTNSGMRWNSDASYSRNCSRTLGGQMGCPRSKLLVDPEAHQNPSIRCCRVIVTCQTCSTPWSSQMDPDSSMMPTKKLQHWTGPTWSGLVTTSS